MKIRQIKTNNGKSKWEVYGHVRGRGSKRLRRRFDRKSDAEGFLIDFKARTRSGASLQDFEETNFRKEAEYWLKSKSGRLSPGQLKRVEGVLAEFLPKIGHLSPKFFGPGFLTEIQTEQLKTNLRAASVNRKLEIVTGILRFSVQHQRLPYNPSAGFEKLKIVRDEMKFWDLNEAQHFLAFSDRKYPLGSADRWKHVVYLLSLNAALRAGEIWGLKVKDLASNGELLLIQRQWDNLRLDFRATKGKKNRRVPCNSALLNELKEIIRIGELESEDLIFRSESNGPIDHNNFRNRVFLRDVAESGLKTIRFHDLRHTGITLLVSAGYDLVTVQAIAGHQDIHTTMGYAHVLADNIRKVAQTFSITPHIADPKPNLRIVRSI